MDLVKKTGHRGADIVWVPGESVPLLQGVEGEDLAGFDPARRVVCPDCEMRNQLLCHGFKHAQARRDVVDLRHARLPLSWCWRCLSLAAGARQSKRPTSRDRERT